MFRIKPLARLAQRERERCGELLPLDDPGDRACLALKHGERLAIDLQLARLFAGGLTLRTGM